MRVQAGDILDVSAPRGSFTLQQGERPVALVKRRHRRHPSPRYAAGTGRRANAGERSGGFTVPATAASIHLRPRCASSSRPCPEAAATFVTAHQSQPIARRSISTRWGASGVPRVRGNGRPARCGLLHLRSSRVYERSRRRPCRLGVARDRLHTENFGSGPSKTPGIAAVPRRPPHPPAEAAEVGPLVSFTRSNLAVHWGSAFHSLLELVPSCISQRT